MPGRATPPPQVPGSFAAQAEDRDREAVLHEPEEASLCCDTASGICPCLSPLKPNPISGNLSAALSSPPPEH